MRVNAGFLLAAMLLCAGASQADTPPPAPDEAAERERAGDMLAAEGEAAGALAAYAESITIGEQIARDEPGNRDWQAAQALLLEKIEALLAGRGTGPVDPRAALAISQLLAHPRPGG